MITNFDKKRYPRHSEKQWNYNLQCSSTEFEGATNEQNKDVFWKKEDPGEICHFIPYLHKGDKVVFLDFAFPNPYIPKQHAKLLIPVPEITDLYKNINVVVFSSNMHEVFSETLPFEVMDDSRIVIDISNKAKDLSSGVYLYKISTEENDFFGKFVVKDTE